MKTILPFGYGLCFFMVALAAQAQLNVDWYSIDGGGGTSTGAAFTVTGTIGQPDAGRMTNSGFTIDGGFWSVIATVPSADLPVLRIMRTGASSIVMAWSTSAIGFSLQQNTNLVFSTWTAVTNLPIIVGSDNQVTISPASGNRYYRLIK